MTETVPVIDCSGLPDDPESLALLDRACRDWGFFQITGHDVGADLIERLMAQMRAFFALPTAEKRRIERTRANCWGFYDRELTKNVRDFKEIFDVGDARNEGPMAGARPQWPEQPPGFEATSRAFMAACHAVAHRVLAGISLNLGMPAEHLAASFRPRHTSFLRLNYYPVCDDPAPPDADTIPATGQLGINRHTDAGALTVLIQDRQPGLQVLRDGAWHIVEPRADALVVNIGDIVQVWSNDRYRAALHRVIVSRASPRYSAPYFFNPDYTASYAPLPSLCDIEHPARYRPINWGEFRAGRAAGDYADYGEEIQISQFRV